MAGAAPRTAAALVPLHALAATGPHPRCVQLRPVAQGAVPSPLHSACSMYESATAGSIGHELLWDMLHALDQGTRSFRHEELSC